MGSISFGHTGHFKWKDNADHAWLLMISIWGKKIFEITMVIIIKTNLITIYTQKKKVHNMETPFLWPESET